jgi:hypothetical protein
MCRDCHACVDLIRKFLEEEVMDIHTLEKEGFRITIHNERGTILSIVNTQDIHQMNWAEGDHEWGDIACLDGKIGGFFIKHGPTNVGEHETVSVLKTDNLNINVKRGFTEHGMFRECYTFTNITKTTLTLSAGDLGIFTPFNDNYQDFATCSRRRCHTHIWCGESTSYIQALRMGGDPPHLGLVVTSGKLSEYSVVRDTSSNDRGDFILHPSLFSLYPGASYELSWVLFWHSGEVDFYRQARGIAGFLQITAKHYTYFLGETIKLEARGMSRIDDLAISVGQTPIAFISHKDRASDTVSMSDSADNVGEKVYNFQYGGRETLCRLIVVPALKDIIKARCEYIADYQQYRQTGSPLYGAYLIYDRESRQIRYGHNFWDHGAGRERIGMGVLLAKFLNSTAGVDVDKKLARSLDLYYEFVSRELYDEETGVVYNRIGRSNHTWHRLYNYPWIVCLQMELFKLKHNSRFLLQMMKSIRAYYAHGGVQFYCLCLPMLESIRLLEQHGFIAQSREILSLYLTHVDTIIANGTDYPAHEVSYEQSIVAPAASYILQAYLLTGHEPYLQAAKEHIAILELFQGNQPDYHLNRISIRHWDGYWFGKRKLYGDTFPHYWSVLSAEAFWYYYQATGKKTYNDMALTILRNNLCLFEESGFGSCAYLYPFSVNNILGKFYDPWANDQDWALVYTMRFLNQ